MTIYRFTNTVNGKIYIGQTVRNLDKRVKEHFYQSSKGCKAFKAALNKYGKESFVLDILDTALNEEELNLKEIAYIELHKSSDRNVGYNLTKGGKTVRAFPKGNNGWGENSEERKKKISLMFKGMPLAALAHIRAKEVNSEPTINLTTGMEFSSAVEMAKYYNLTYTYVVKLLNGHARQKNGEIFRHKDLEKQRQADIRMSFVPIHKALPKKIICLDTQESFESIKTASQKLGILRTAIGNNLAGRSKSAGGFSFAYAELQLSNGEII
ncbi:MAG TPA: GIY-YIG nuclease family protein [Rhabdochlamydiaceae bacterium]